jgi:hypothetical protein
MYTYIGTTAFTPTFYVNVTCAAFTAPASHAGLQTLYARYAADAGKTNQIVRNYATELASAFNLDTCLYCTSLKLFRLVQQSAPATVYSGTGIRIDQSSLDLLIDTSSGMLESLYYEAYSDDSYCSTFFGTQRTMIDIQVCGQETISVANVDTQQYFYAIWDEGANF